MTGATMISPSKARFLKKHEVARLATASKQGMPHVTPVIYVFDGRSFVVAIDYGTKKLSNLRENPFASLVVDEYGAKNKAVMVQGRCRILEKGVEYRRLQRALFERFESYRQNPWKEGEAPIIRLYVDRVVSWGLQEDSP